MIGIGSKMPLEALEWRYKALELIPGRLPFGF
nr:MAG TPA: cell division cylcle protein 27 [Caudoviricetes sp.]